MLSGFVERSELTETERTVEFGFWRDVERCREDS